MESICKFNRFGEELANVSTSGNGVSEEKLNDKLSEVQYNCYSNTIDEINKIRPELLDYFKENILNKLKMEFVTALSEQFGLEKNYLSLKGKRIVNVGKAIDKLDVVVKEQLENVNKKVESILKGLEVTKDCIKIKNGRKICGISRSNDAYDAINGVELMELTRRIHKIEVKLGKSKATTVDI